MEVPKPPSASAVYDEVRQNERDRVERGGRERERERDWEEEREGSRESGKTISLFSLPMCMHVFESIPSSFFPSERPWFWKRTDFFFLSSSSKIIFQDLLSLLRSFGDLLGEAVFLSLSLHFDFVSNYHRL